MNESKNQKRKIRLIGLDLDGTTLTTDKRLTPHTKEVLEACLKQGIEVLPATGRVWSGIPKELTDIEGVHYVISSNGAAVVELATGKAVYTNGIAWERALEAEGFTASVGEVLQSANGSQIHVQEKTKDTLTLDRLEPKDSVTVTYEAIVKARQVGTASLKNTVKVTGQKYNGTPVAETKYMKDSDTIQVNGEEPSSEPGTGTNGVPKTGDETPLIPWLLTGLASLTAAAVILLVRQRRRR